MFVFIFSALVGIEAIPDKLNPVIKPLMESIKRETSFEILCIVAKKLVGFLFKNFFAREQECFTYTYSYTRHCQFKTV